MSEPRTPVEALRWAAWALAANGARSQSVADTPLRELKRQTGVDESGAYEWQLSCRARAETYDDVLDVLIAEADRLETMCVDP